jgi:hypothetical protein
MKIFLFATVLVFLLGSVTSGRSPLEKPEIIESSQRKFIRCIWKICSKPLKKIYQEKLDRIKANEFAILKLLSNPRNRINF